MAQVTLHHPNPVRIPETVHVKRAMLFLHSSITGEAIPVSEHAGYDAKTIFYDVFISSGGQQVIALGPPLYNLRESLLPLEIRCSGILVNFTQKSFNRFWQILFTIPKSLVGKDFELELRFSAFETCLLLTSRNEPDCRHDLALTTLQKDNPSHWVTDWCQWHYKLHGISHFLLYDNDSRTFPALKKALEELDLPIQIKLIHWPFPYGTLSNLSNKFAQTGSLNHAREFWGINYQWMINLDIDEYLSAGRDLDIKSVLNHKSLNNCAIILLDSWHVPPHENQKPQSFRAAADHTYRIIRLVKENKKYIFRPQLTVFNDVHKAMPKSIWLHHEWIMRPLYRSIPRHLYNMPWLRRVWPLQEKVRYYSHDDMCFYHFKGLNTNWKTALKIAAQSESFAPTRHVIDLHLQSMLEKAGLRSLKAIDSDS